MVLSLPSPVGATLGSTHQLLSPLRGFPSYWGFFLGLMPQAIACRPCRGLFIPLMQPRMAALNYRPIGSAGAVFQRDADFREPLADLIRHGEVLLLAYLSPKLDQ